MNRREEQCPICGKWKICIKAHIKAVHKGTEEYRQIKESERDSGRMTEADYMTWGRL